jgi:putative hemolysin
MFTIQKQLQNALSLVALIISGLALITLGACTGPTPQSTPGMPNPASVHCEEQGGRVEMRTDENGQYGVCVFSDGSECEEWAFYRGECDPGTVAEETSELEATVSIPTPAQVRDIALAYIRANRQIASPEAGWIEEDLTPEGLVGASTFQYTAASWVVTVSFPIVAPDFTIYTVVATDQANGFQWEGEIDVAGQVTERSVTEGASLKDVSYEGVSFSYSDALAADVVGQVIPADGDDTPDWARMPAHIRLSFEGYALPETFHEPRILVFLAEDLAGNEILQGIAANIQRILAEKPDQPVGIFQGAGILPPMNAGPMVVAQVAYFDFQNGSGVRFLTQMGQAYYPINNHDLFYTYQGMTHDGKYYVAAILPISHPTLPADGSVIPGGDFDVFADNFETYSAEVAAQLNGEDAGSFAPSITMLDAVVQSLEVTLTR